MTDPAPDISLPGVFSSLTPGGTDPAALMKALKASRRAPMTKPPEPADKSLIWCRKCSRPHLKDWLCPDPEEPESPSLAGASEAMLPSLPADPFTPGGMADAATAEWFHGLVEAGIPVASVERSIGAMFAGIILGREGKEGQP